MTEPNIPKKRIGIPFEEVFAGFMENKAFREEWWWGDNTDSILMRIRCAAGLTQEKLAKKMKIPQSSIARAESRGCSLKFLTKAAKATGHYLEIAVKKAEYNPKTKSV